MNIKKVTLFSILNGTILLILTLCDFYGIFNLGMIFSYQWHKILHITGVVIFMGNMIVGPVWFSYAYYSKDKVLLKFASKLLQVTDLYLTIPGIALTVLNGLCMTAAFGGIKNVPWLYNSTILLFVMWALSIPLIFLQEKMYSAMDNEPGNEIKIKILLLYWSILGTIIMIPPTIIYYLMITKGV